MTTIRQDIDFAGRMCQQLEAMCKDHHVEEIQTEFVPKDPKATPFKLKYKGTGISFACEDIQEVQAQINLKTTKLKVGYWGNTYSEDDYPASLTDEYEYTGFSGIDSNIE